jgi:hypothetical protein
MPQYLFRVSYLNMTLTYNAKYLTSRCGKSRISVMLFLDYLVVKQYLCQLQRSFPHQSIGVRIKPLLNADSVSGIRCWITPHSEFFPAAWARWIPLERLNDVGFCFCFCFLLQTSLDK